MNPIYEKLVKCADAVKSKIKFQPQVALAERPFILMKGSMSGFMHWYPN